MNRNRFNVNNRSALAKPVRSTNVSLANGFGTSQQDARTPKIITTYLGLLYLVCAEFHH
jgi:hypothetical protein